MLPYYECLASLLKQFPVRLLLGIPLMFGVTLLPFSLCFMLSLGFKCKYSLRYKMRNKATKQTDVSGLWQLGHTALESSNFSFSMYFFFQITIISKYLQD